jgi:hypothetical protein
MSQNKLEKSLSYHPKGSDKTALVNQASRPLDDMIKKEAADDASLDAEASLEPNS